VLVQIAALAKSRPAYSTGMWAQAVVNGHRVAAQLPTLRKYALALIARKLALTMYRRNVKHKKNTKNEWVRMNKNRNGTGVVASALLEAET
jgi:hypothetical protein